MSEEIVQKPGEKRTALIIMVVAFIGMALASWASSERGKEKERAMPWTAAKAHVSSVLKSPATAVFPEENSPAVSIKPVGGNRWLVVGYVDSQNSFGATVRDEWEAVVEKQDGKWERISLRIGDKTL